MAYSGKVSLNNIYEAWTYIIRFITEDSATAGKDWQITRTNQFNASNNLERKEFQGTLTSVVLDTWINLPTVSVFDYSFGTKITGEVVGTGDGATTSFNYTIANTPIGAYSVEINYTISGSNYIAYDDGAGNISGTSVSGTIDYTTGSLSLTFTTAPDNGTNITIDYLHNSLTEGTDYQIDTNLGKVQFLSTGSVTASSNVDYFYNFKKVDYDLHNTGLAGQDDINIILRPVIDTQESVMYVKGLLYDYFDNGLNNYVGLIEGRAISYWNNIVDLWVFSNKQRIIIVVKSGNYYSSMYIGFLHKVWNTQTYSRPYMLVASHSCANDLSSQIKFDNETDDARWFILSPSVIYWKLSGGFISEGFASYGRFSPHLYNYGNNLIAFTYPTGIDVSLFPIFLTPNNNFVVGLLDNVYLYIDANVTAESVITDSNNKTYVVFPDVFRTSIKHWYAIMEE